MMLWLKNEADDRLDGVHVFRLGYDGPAENTYAGTPPHHLRWGDVRIFNINVLTILQIATPSEMRGRVFGLLGTIASGLAPLGMGLGGVVADLTGQDVPLIYLACGLLASLFAVLGSMSREFRRFLSQEPTPE